MLDLIYIVEESLASAASDKEGASYTPNFTIPGQDTSITTAKQSYSGVALTAAGVATSLLIPFLPFSLIAGATAAVAGAAGANAFASRSNSATAEEGSTAVSALAEETRVVAAYLQHHSLSRTQAKGEGYCFQPGHPVVGKAYRRHPLSDYSSPENGNLYIPSDSYDAILLEERESELIKLLVNLGATHISITKKGSDKTRKIAAAEASVQVGLAGGGDISYTGKSERDMDTLDIREFSLKGRPWKADSQIDRESFFWLSYEPSWKAVVFAREVGGCLSASLEIKENTSFSTDKNFELSVKAKLVEAGARASHSNFETEEKTYFVRAEFSAVSHDA